MFLIFCATLEQDVQGDRVPSVPPCWHNSGCKFASSRTVITRPSAQRGASVWVQGLKDKLAGYAIDVAQHTFLPPTSTHVSSRSSWNPSHHVPPRPSPCTCLPSKNQPLPDRPIDIFPSQLPPPHPRPHPLRDPISISRVCCYGLHPLIATCHPFSFFFQPPTATISPHSSSGSSMCQFLHSYPKPSSFFGDLQTHPWDVPHNTQRPPPPCPWLLPCQSHRRNVPKQVPQHLWTQSRSHATTSENCNQQTNNTLTQWNHRPMPRTPRTW